jgi:type I restriction enzyme R subunit
VAAITRLGTHKLMEANEKATALLIKGLTVEGLPGWDGGRGQTIRYIDWDTPANNRFTVVNQYRVDCPPGFNSAKAFIVPDLVLLVNGIPLVVVECKSPSIPEPLAEAVDQLRRYSNQRKAAFEVDDNEGNEPCLPPTSCWWPPASTRRGWAASARPSSTSPVEDGGRPGWYRQRNRRGPGTGQSSPVRAGAADRRPADTPHLLDVVQNFMLFMQAGGQTIKTVCRYQQYRAVNRAIARLKTGQTRCSMASTTSAAASSGTPRARARADHGVPGAQDARRRALRRFKVIVVTDRKDLQRQLSVTATLTGEVVDMAESTAGVKALARRKGPA